MFDKQIWNKTGILSRTVGKRHDQGQFKYPENDSVEEHSTYAVLNLDPFILSRMDIVRAIGTIYSNS